MTQYQPDAHWMPLTLAQLDFWEEFCLHPDTAVSTVAHVIELRGVTHPGALRRAIETTIAETDITALRFSLGADGQPRQRIDPGRRPPLRRMVFDRHEDGRARAFAMMQADVDAPLDLLTRPIAAQWLIRLGEGHYLWFNRGHHIALDGYGMALVERRCAALYAALTQGTDPGPPLRPLADYLNEETDYRASPRHTADGQHWAGVLASVPRLHVLKKGSENYPTEAFEAGHDLSALRAALMQQTQLAGIGWPDLLTALCAIWAGLSLADGSAARRPDADGRIAMPVWLPYMSRMGSVSVAVPALVVNILPLAVDLHPDETLEAVLTRLGTSLRKLRRHGRYRIEQIAQDSGVGAQSRFFFSPLINVLPFDEAHFPGCVARREVLSNGPGDGFNITIRSDGQAEGLELLIEADPALTPGADFARLADSLPRFLSRALAGAALSRPLRELLG
ncbi:condensation domain-containing protein [Paracoccus lutimaris]|uniref:Enterobactin synthetase component F n=1 Tax=Paracoccus lutimaris TaxID=1490030 RepID=A0A368YUE1_9RHOB|nr:condensation domain-containing protein [Paracoccus lutimaris]RCW82886.1 enterobactin synthetase component F [Paracoccus lutimaris]